MTNPNREIDKTHLSIDQAEERGFIHRDYIAHCLRWSHVCKHLNQLNRYKQARILDVGCGKELPLLKTLYTSRMSPLTYTGFDMNKINCSVLPKIKEKMGEANIDIWDKTDFSDPDMDLEDLGPFTVMTCLEVLEHVSPEKCIKILKRLYHFMNKDTVLFISTPCWNGKAAANHINEMTYKALGCILEQQGFFITNHWGTFASQRDIEPELQTMYANRHDSKDFLYIYNTLKEYYDSNYVSTIFAPLFPSKSRNVLWQLRKGDKDHKSSKLFPKLTTLDHQWSQHKNWRDLNNDGK